MLLSNSKKTTDQPPAPAVIDRDEAERLLLNQGHLISGDGADFGVVKRIYLDEYTSWPSFACIASPTDTVSQEETFVALHEAIPVGQAIQVPYPSDQIITAPTASPDVDLSITEEDQLFEYYRVPIDGVEPVVSHLGAVLASGLNENDIAVEYVNHSS